ncbi:MAG: hypothetical protein C4293_00470 [Nitrospiraceae bacterium]
MKTSGWLVNYGIAIFLVLLLGATLGNIALFKETVLGDTKLRAFHLGQFMGYGGALLLLWLLGRRATLQIPDKKEWFFLCDI